MGLGKFLKKAALAPLKVVKKSVQLAHKATTAPAKKLGILPKDKPKAAPVVKKESAPATKTHSDEGNSGMAGKVASAIGSVKKEKVQKLAMKKSTKKPPFFTA